ncbi:MAG: extracellular solute-binding protein [Saccharospirillum sp.]
MKKAILSTALAACCATAGIAQAQTTLELARFFGDCDNAGTDVSAAVGEACIIQTIINAYDAEDNGVSVDTLPTDWGNYYDQLMAMYAGGNAPDVHVIHKHRIAQFASLGALQALPEEDLRNAGIDPDDWAPRAREAVSYNGEMYGVPMDFHANLWHINMGLMEEAGLVDDNGQPILPSSPEELVEHARMVKDATGVDYLTADFAEFPIGVRLVLAMLWQQGTNIFDGDEVTVNTPEARRAVETIMSLFDGDYARPNLNYNDSQQAFLAGEAAILVNGTWVVDFYDAEAAKADVALNDYYAADFPTLFDTPATWADSHLWSLPSTIAGEPEKYEAALSFLAWLNDHNIDWARTGHLAVRESVLASDEYQALPKRDGYTNTVNIARDTPASTRYSAIQDVLNRELQSIWLQGKDIEQALADAEREINRIR